jgi:hypothetical protein
LLGSHPAALLRHPADQTDRRGRIAGGRLVPSRRDVEPLVAKMDQNRLKVKRIPKEVSLNTDQYAKEFREVFGI